MAQVIVYNMPEELKEYAKKLVEVAFDLYSENKERENHIKSMFRGHTGYDYRCEIKPILHGTTGLNDNLSQFKSDPQQYWICLWHKQHNIVIGDQALSKMQFFK
ncbi:unnamed protein product [Schistosoma turkestanicum]|nr:unnamed protein product [Schistosoma turkestanicum]